MKIRYGFVTNSSSSSFIIKKKDSFNSVEDVYQTVKQLYVEFKNVIDNAVNACKDNPKYTIVRDKDDNNKVVHITLTKEKGYDWLTETDAFEAEFGIGLLDYLGYNLTWMETCPTYQDFLKKFEGEYGPFRILDFSKPEDRDSDEEESLMSILCWYMPCYDDNSRNCNTCRYTKYCDFNKKCPDLIDKVKDANGDIDGVFEVFGQFCVASECGYIPDYVVQRLSGLSTFACNHMG